jgi:hypothetical protein
VVLVDLGKMCDFGVESTPMRDDRHGIKVAVFHIPSKP